MELENPNDLTLTLSPERSIMDAHAAVTDLTAARAVILKITQYTNEVKTYKKDDLTITKNSITIPGAIKSGQGFDIELKLMNTVCTYIARAKSVTIEPYTNRVITLEIEEIKPHIILPAKKTNSPRNCTFFAVANPEKKDGLVFEGSRDSSISDFAFDKYGRLFLLHTPGGSTNTEFSSYDNLVNHPQTGSFKNLCIDIETNTSYYTKSYHIKACPMSWNSFGAETTGVIFDPNNTTAISVGKNYCVGMETHYNGSTYWYTFKCLNKFDIKNILKEVDIKFSVGVYPSDIIIDGDILYVLLGGASQPNTTLGKSSMKIYSLPDFKLLKTVTGFYNGTKFLGKRDGKLYIADKVIRNPPPNTKRLGIYDTLTGKLKFIDVKEFSNEIEFQW
nr:MAG: hypothetical protein CR988_04225 [Treponema sp.]